MDNKNLVCNKIIKIDEHLRCRMEETDGIYYLKLYFGESFFGNTIEIDPIVAEFIFGIFEYGKEIRGFEIKALLG